MGQKSSRLPLCQVSPSSLISQDLNTVDIGYFEDLFYSLADENLFSSLTPGFIRILITSKPGNVKILINRIFKDFQSFVSNPDVVFFVDIITRIHTLSSLFSMIFESPFADFHSTFFWKTSESFEEPFGRQLVHLIMRLLFLPLFTSSLINIPSSKLFGNISDDLIVNRRLLWYVI
jgi:hypothetical protein